MHDAPENLVLVYLRRLDEKVDRVASDIRDLKVRVTSLEQVTGTIKSRLYRIEDRLERIERRLDLVGSTP